MAGLHSTRPVAAAAAESMTTFSELEITPGLDSTAVTNGGKIEEDDLLALLGSDTFSLESARDRDLNVLSSFLSKALPNNQHNHHHAAVSVTTESRPKARHYNSQQAAFSSNPNGTTTTNGTDEGMFVNSESINTPLGTPASFNSNVFFPPAPANSYNSQYFYGAGGGGGALGASPEEERTLMNGNAVESRWRAKDGTMNGYRAPAPSRSRDRSNEQMIDRRVMRSSTSERPSRIPESSMSSSRHQDDEMMSDN